MKNLWKAVPSFMILVAGLEGAAAAGPNVTRHAVQVEHVRIVSTRPFDQVAGALERLLPELDPAVTQALLDGDESRATQLEHGQKLFRFLTRNPGDLLRIVGRPAKARQYEIGNPLTATRMTRHQSAAALYAPLRVLLYENPAGGSTFEYDRPSTLFGQFGDTRVMSVGRELDVELADALKQAAR